MASTLRNDQPLTPTRIQTAVAELGRVDPDLADIAARHGCPPMWAKRPGFATLVLTILEQQVSLKAARTIYRRLQTEVGRITATRIAPCRITDLRAAGITSSKSSFIISLARAVVDGDIDLAALGDLDDDGVRRQLTSLRGIGPWTADVYLLMVLRRPDVWPVGDLALAVSMERIKRLRLRPDTTRQQEIARRWRPWRSVAARMLWQDYLARQAARGKRAS